MWYKCLSLLIIYLKLFSRVTYAVNKYRRNNTPSTVGPQDSNQKKIKKLAHKEQGVERLSNEEHNVEAWQWSCAPYENREVKASDRKHWLLQRLRCGALAISQARASLAAITAPHTVQSYCNSRIAVKLSELFGCTHIRRVLTYSLHSFLHSVQASGTVVGVGKHDNLCHNRHPFRIITYTHSSPPKSSTQYPSYITSKQSCGILIQLLIRESMKHRLLAQSPRSGCHQQFLHCHIGSTC